MTNKIGRPRKYPFGDLKVGESFVVPLRSMGHRTSIAASANYFERTYGGRFRTRVIVFVGDAILSPSHSHAGKTGTHCQVTRVA